MRRILRHGSTELTIPVAWSIRACHQQPNFPKVSSGFSATEVDPDTSEYPRAGLATISTDVDDEGLLGVKLTQVMDNNPSQYVVRGSAASLSNLPPVNLSPPQEGEEVPNFFFADDDAAVASGATNQQEAGTPVVEPGTFEYLLILKNRVQDLVDPLLAASSRLVEESKAAGVQKIQRVGETTWTGENRIAEDQSQSALNARIPELDSMYVDELKTIGREIHQHYGDALQDRSHTLCAEVKEVFALCLAKMRKWDSAAGMMKEAVLLSPSDDRIEAFTEICVSSGNVQFISEILNGPDVESFGDWIYQQSLGELKKTKQEEPESKAREMQVSWQRFIYQLTMDSICKLVFVSSVTVLNREGEGAAATTFADALGAFYDAFDPKLAGLQGNSEVSFSMWNLQTSLLSSMLRYLNTVASDHESDKNFRQHSEDKRVNLMRTVISSLRALASSEVFLEHGTKLPGHLKVEQIIQTKVGHFATLASLFMILQKSSNESRRGEVIGLAELLIDFYEKNSNHLRCPGVDAETYEAVRMIYCEEKSFLSFKNARPLIDRLITDFPQSPEPFVILALAYQREGNIDDARGAALAALDIDPTNQRAAVAIRGIEDKAGNKELAKALALAEHLHFSTAFADEGYVVSRDETAGSNLDGLTAEGRPVLDTYGALTPEEDELARSVETREAKELRQMYARMFEQKGGLALRDAASDKIIQKLKSEHFAQHQKNDVDGLSYVDELKSGEAVSSSSPFSWHKTNEESRVAWFQQLQRKRTAK